MLTRLHEPRPCRIVRTSVSIAAVFFLLPTLTGGAALGCGYEDPQVVAMGALNLVYPESLHVGTAVWQAQAEGRLPRDFPRDLPPPLRPVVRAFAAPLVAAAVVTPVATPDPASVAPLLEAMNLLAQFRQRLDAAGQLTERPNLTTVFASKMLWARFVPGSEGVIARTHVAGPEPGDVVLITEAVVLRALLSGSMALDEVLERKLIRLYGETADVSASVRWLATLPPSITKTGKGG